MGNWCCLWWPWCGQQARQERAKQVVKQLTMEWRDKLEKKLAHKRSKKEQHEQKALVLSRSGKRHDAIRELRSAELENTAIQVLEKAAMETWKSEEAINSVELASLVNEMHIKTTHVLSDATGSSSVRSAEKATNLLASAMDRVRDMSSAVTDPMTPTGLTSDSDLDLRLQELERMSSPR